MSSLKCSPHEDTYRSIGYALKRAQQALRNFLDSEFRNIGLTTPQYSVLAGLEFREGLSNADLARRAFVTPQTMQAIIVTLERQGFVTRAAHREHGRVLTTALTNDGRLVLKAAHEIAAKAETRARSVVAPDDQELVYSALLRIADAMR